MQLAHFFICEVDLVVQRTDRKRSGSTAVINPFFNRSIAFNPYGIVIRRTLGQPKHEQVLVMAGNVPTVTVELLRKIADCLAHIHMVSQMEVDFVPVIHSSCPKRSALGSLVREAEQNRARKSSDITWSCAPISVSGSARQSVDMISCPWSSSAAFEDVSTIHLTNLVRRDEFHKSLGVP